MSIPKSIIFGATGAVGSSVARTASALGAPIVLAMRDISKPVLGFSTAARSGHVERVRADLTKPDTIISAVSSTGATRAFIYAIHASPDHMRSAIAALKASGISFVVFLSSFTVRGTGAALRDIKPSEVISYGHAQVEIVLEEVFGEGGFAALRPGAFASNILQHKQGIVDGAVHMQGRKSFVDCIVPEDIGQVGGMLLVNGLPDDGQSRPYLFGPKLMTKEESIGVVAKVLGLGQVQVTGPSKHDAFKYLVEEKKMSETFARYMSEQSGKDEENELSVEGDLQVFGYKVPVDLLQNVEKYTGRPATTFENWVLEDKKLFERSEKI